MRPRSRLQLERDDRIHAHAHAGATKESLELRESIAIGDDAAEISAATMSAATARYLDGRRYVRVNRMPTITTANR
jgi:hypothetical protein